MLYALAPSRFRTPAQRFDVDSQDTDSARSTTGYNHAMSIAAPRWVGVAGLLGLLTGAIVLMAAPGNPGAVRLSGMSLLWWYAAVVAPLAAILLVVAVQRAPGETRSGTSGWAAAAAWTSPVVLGLVAAGAFAGAPAAPAVALAVLVAPLVARLDPVVGEASRPSVVARLAIAVGVGLILWANFLLFVDVARGLSVPRWATSVVVAAVALLVPVFLRGNLEASSRVSLAVAGGVAFVALVAVVGIALATSPWGAWKSVASRPALTFAERDPWVTAGRTLTAPIALDFTELHRVTALSPAIYRVDEPGRFREWQLREGESLTLRAGDRLVLDAGARLRFEAGKRIPGAAASGVAWADPPRRNAPLTVVEMIGATLTLVAGALALVGPPSPTTVRGAAALLPAMVLGAFCLGVYGVYAAPGLIIGAPALAAVFHVPATVVPGPAGRVLAWLTALVLLALLTATVLALRGVLAAACGVQSRGELTDRVMTGLVVLAAVASLWPADPSWALLTGLGVIASAVVAPRLAADEPVARLAGSLVGAAAFACLALFRLPAWASVAGAYPALTAAPLAWIAARVTRGSARAV